MSESRQGPMPATVARLRPEQIEKLRRYAKAEDRSVSWVIRKAIDEFLARWGV